MKAKAAFSFAAALVAALCTFGSGSASGATLFFDDFNAGASAAWSNDRGVWRDTGGVYDASVPDNSPLTYSVVNTFPSLTNFVVDVDVNAFNDGGIWLRSNISGSGISGVLLVTGGKSGSFDGLYWHTVVNDGAVGGILNEAALAGLQGGNHHLRIVVDGNTYSVYVDGALSPLTTLTTALFASGHAGLYDFSPISGASDPRGQTFDNFQISVNPVPLPAALPLFAAGAGIIGLLARRRKRNSATAAG